jgi:hypothetical protein
MSAEIIDLASRRQARKIRQRAAAPAALHDLCRRLVMLHTIGMIRARYATGAKHKRRRAAAKKGAAPRRLNRERSEAEKTARDKHDSVSRHSAVLQPE